MRYKQRIRDSPSLLEIIDNLYFNSIGGSALQVGSIKVNTINLARIAYESEDKSQYLATLKEKTEICLKSLDVIRSIIKRNVEKGLLPNFALGVTNFETKYNTIGIIGIYETLQKFGLVIRDEFGYSAYTEEGLNFAKKILKTIQTVKDNFLIDKTYMANIEQIPGERAAAVLMQKDRFFYPNERYELPLYGNQWIPLGIKTTLAEKVRLSAELDKACNGGSIAHINLDAPLENEETAWDLLNYIADAGVQYFAFNLKIAACEHNHGFYGTTCPTCGGKPVTYYTRIVGFLTPILAWSKERKAEGAMRTPVDISQIENK